MERSLHITNGDAVSLQETGLGGEVLAWQDALHEGPVSAVRTLDELRPVRAGFLARLSARPESEILASMEARDETLAHFQEFQEIILWFEHDLYDQLQLIQILNWFARHQLGTSRLSLIDSDRYLGPMTPAELLDLYPSRVPVTPVHFAEASRAWQAFCSPDPRPLTGLAEEGFGELLHLSGALSRHLEQFPSTENGLSRTERQILQVLAGGVSRVASAFVATGDCEERLFMGDHVFFAYVRNLAGVPVPLLRILKAGQYFGDNVVEITAEGRAVLAGDADHIELNGIDRWLGGVHLSGRKVWRWNGKNLTFA